MAIRRLRGGRVVASRPPMSTRPASTFSRPARQRSSVVLPQPDGPSSTTKSPSATSRSTSSTAVTLPKVLRIAWKRTSAIYFSTLLLQHPSPHREQVATDEQDHDHGRGHEEEPTGEAEVRRRALEQRENLRGQRPVAEREERGGKDLVPGDDEDEDRRRREPGQRERERDLHERRGAATAEGHRRLLELGRDAGEDARRREDDERQGQRGMRDRNAQHGVVDAPADENDGERNREDDDRERPRPDDREPERVPTAKRESRERVAGRRPDHERNHQRDESDDDAALERVEHAAEVDEEPHRLRREASREQLLRVVIGVLVARESRERHQVDRDEDEERQEHGAPVDEDPPEPGDSGTRRGHCSICSRGVRRNQTTIPAETSERTRINAE